MSETPATPEAEATPVATTDAATVVSTSTPASSAPAPATPAASGSGESELVEALKEQEVSVRALIEAGCHYGHQPGRWNPLMRSYIFGERNGTHIIDLDQTLPMFTEALDFVRETTAAGGVVLFVGTKRQAQGAIMLEAKRAGQHYVNNRWLGGMLTNWKTVKKSIDRYNQYIEILGDEEKSGELSKKEHSSMTRQVEKYAKSLEGIRAMQRPAGRNLHHRRRERNRSRSRKPSACTSRSSPSSIPTAIRAGSISSCRAMTTRFAQSISTARPSRTRVVKVLPSTRPRLVAQRRDAPAPAKSEGGPDNGTPRRRNQAAAPSWSWTERAQRGVAARATRRVGGKGDDAPAKAAASAKAAAPATPSSGAPADSGRFGACGRSGDTFFGGSGGSSQAGCDTRGGRPGGSFGPGRRRRQVGTCPGRVHRALGAGATSVGSAVTKSWGRRAPPSFVTDSGGREGLPSTNLAGPPSSIGRGRRSSTDSGDQDSGRDFCR